MSKITDRYPTLTRTFEIGTIGNVEKLRYPLLFSTFDRYWRDLVASAGLRPNTFPGRWGLEAEVLRNDARIFHNTSTEGQLEVQVNLTLSSEELLFVIRIHKRGHPEKSIAIDRVTVVLLDKDRQRSRVPDELTAAVEQAALTT